MTRKATPDYPGKPGPAPSGLKRDILFPLSLDSDEFEYVIRKSTEVFGSKRKAGPFIRKLLFRSAWKDDLAALRQKQGANLKPE